MEFNNRRFFKQQKISILKSGLKINKKTLFDSSEYEVSFERMTNKIHIKTSVSNNFLLLSFFLMFLALVGLTGENFFLGVVLALISIVFTVIAFLTRLKTVTIDCYDNENIILYFNNNNKETVTDFANQIIISCNNFLLTKYGKIDKDLPFQSQLNNLEFLRDREIITLESFESLKDQLLGRENKSSIGFTK